MITEGENLYIHFEKNVTDRKKFLESFMAKMKTPYKGVVIEVQDGYNLLTDYGMDLTPAQFIEYFDTEKLWSFKDRKERRLDERQYHDTYKEWGLMSPSGKFYSSLDPMFSEFMDENNPLNFFHGSMWEFISTGKISKFNNRATREKKAKKFEQAVDDSGWIRWAVEDIKWRDAVYLNIDMNLGKVSLRNILKLLKNISADYRKIHLDLTDRGYNFVNRTQFLSFLKTELLDENVSVFNEDPHEIEWYRDWGWVAPDGDIISGLMRKDMTTHEQLYKDIVGETRYKKYKRISLSNALVKYGWIRWFTYKNPDGYYVLTCVGINHEGIDKKITKLYRHVKKDISYIEIDLVLSNKKTHKFFSGSNLEEVLREFSAYVNKGKG
jgi:hypothetical protein